MIVKIMDGEEEEDGIDDDSDSGDGLSSPASTRPAFPSTSHQMLNFRSHSIPIDIPAPQPH
jgi:hypothetical protein